MGPLSPEEQEGLLVTHTIDKEEVYALEQENIQLAIAWTFRKKLNVAKLFSESFITELHRQMFGQVWDRAGTFRITNKNIGIQYYQVPIELKQLLDDAIYWYDNEIYSPEALSIQFKHRLVSIHCFPNGNGRHSRLMADLIMEKLYSDKFFTWGGSQLVKNDQKREQYITALRKADKGDISDLIAFTKS